MRDEINRIADKFGYLPYMIERYLKIFGKTETLEFLEANETPPSKWIRVNTLKISPEELNSRLTEKGILLEKSEWLPYAFKIIKDPLNIGSLHEYLQGYYYIQDIASMLPAYFLNPQPRDLVIDMAAAPGGKSTHLAQLMNNKGSLLLIERNKKRIPALEFNLRRLGVNNSIVLNFDSNNLEILDLKADKILLDSPCTGEGLIRQDPTRKKSKKYQDILKMSSVQENLLLEGLNCLKKNGLLLYSTCSIAPEENEMVINSVLRKRNDINIIKLKEKFGCHGFINIYGDSLNNELHFAQRFYPHKHDSIGFFTCLFKKL